MSRVTLTVPDISCRHCEMTVKQALAPVPGVRSVAVDIPAKQVTVQYEETQTDVERFKAVLAAEDYPVAAAAEVRG